jgi:transposase
MWTPEARALVGDLGAGRALSDEQYRLIEPLIPPAKPGGRPRTTDMRRLLDALFYVVRTGCQWRHLPPPPLFPPWPTVYRHFRALLAAGTWESMRHRLVVTLRERDGREPSPSAAVVDSQSVKTTEKGVARLRRRQEGQGPQAAGRGRHVGPAARHRRPRRRHPGRGWGQGTTQAAEAPLLLDEGCVHRQRLRQARSLPRLLSARSHPGHRPPPRQKRRLRPPPTPLGGRTDAGLARPLAPSGQRLRGAARGLRGHGQARHDPAHAAAPLPPEPQATANSHLAFETAS